MVAEANAYCDHLHEMPPVSRRSPQQTGVIQRRLASLSKALRNTAAYLPAGKDLNEAHAARHALQVEESKRAQAGLARPPGPDVRFERLQLRIYHDELALGLTCAGEVARAAHQTEHIFATAAR